MTGCFKLFTTSFKVVKYIYGITINKPTDVLINLNMIIEYTTISTINITHQYSKNIINVQLTVLTAQFTAMFKCNFRKTG